MQTEREAASCWHWEGRRRGAGREEQRVQAWRHGICRIRFLKKKERRRAIVRGVPGKKPDFYIT